MRRAVGSLGIILLLLLLAAPAGAQGPAGVGSVSRSGPDPSLGSDFASWQFSLNYQYSRINLTGNPFMTNGLNTSFARYFGRWIGIEGQFDAGFGNTGTTTSPVNLNVTSSFAGGGPHLAYRNRSSIEPWVHVVVGWEHFKFTQTSGLLGDNSALAGAAGGGVDFHLGNHTALRISADAVGSRFFSTYQRHFEMVSGLVFNF
jgi:hypothetical protein